MSEWLLAALDGANPLAYLAALGTLRTSGLAFPGQNVRMRWSQAEGGWRPLVLMNDDVNMDAWLAKIYLLLCHEAGHRAFEIADDLTLSLSAFRTVAIEATRLAHLGDRRFADFVAAFGSEAVESEANGKKTGAIADTAFRTMSGAGHQHFLGFMRTLAKDTNLEHIKSTLLRKWRYSDAGPSMRWDPNDDRRYALRWAEPSSDPILTVRGANRLAIEALPVLPTAPTNGRLETTGFRQRKGREVVWTWPIWTKPIGVDVLRSLLSLPELQKEAPDRASLAAMGVAEIYRCYRITQGKYRNFTVAQPA